MLKLMPIKVGESTLNQIPKVDWTPKKVSFYWREIHYFDD